MPLGLSKKSRKSPGGLGAVRSPAGFRGRALVEVPGGNAPLKPQLFLQSELQRKLLVITIFHKDKVCINNNLKCNFQRGSIFELQHFLMSTFLYLPMYKALLKLLHWLYYMIWVADLHIHV